MTEEQRRCASCGRPPGPAVVLTVEIPDGMKWATTICARCRPWAERLIGSLGLYVESRAEEPLEQPGPGAGPGLTAPAGSTRAETPPAAPRIGRGERAPLTHRMTALERDLAVVDTEWNKSNADEAEIIALGIVRLRPDGTGYRTAYTVKPGKPVEPQTTAVHGLTDEMLADLPPFEAYADRILADLADADIGGYTVANDLSLIERELERAGLVWATDGVQVVDALRIWQTAEPRRLADAHERFVGPMDGGCTPHDAGDDAVMTAQVIEALAGATSAAGIQRLTDPDRIDLTGKFRRSDDGEVVFDFGKYKHRPAREEPGQLRWMLDRGFAPSAKAVARRLLEEHHPGADTVDPGGRFARNADGEIVFNFGKYKGQPARLEPGFLNWMLGKDFPEETKAVARGILDSRSSGADSN